MDDRAFNEFIEQLLAETAAENSHTTPKPTAEQKYISLDGKSFKKSASVRSFRDYLCEACGKTFTQNHSLREHEKYACKKGEMQKHPNEECPECGKIVCEKAIYGHKKYACKKGKRKSAQRKNVQNVEKWFVK